MCSFNELCTIKQKKNKNKKQERNKASKNFIISLVNNVERVKKNEVKWAVIAMRDLVVQLMSIWMLSSNDCRKSWNVKMWIWLQSRLSLDSICLWLHFVSMHIYIHKWHIKRIIYCCCLLTSCKTQRLNNIINIINSLMEYFLHDCLSHWCRCLFVLSLCLLAISNRRLVFEYAIFMEFRYWNGLMFDT